MSFKTVSILGCGWLGFPLAQHLIRHGFILRGSTSHPEKIAAFKKNNIDPYLISCSPDVQGERIKEFLACDVLVITIPFKRDLIDPNYYRLQIEAIINSLTNSSVRLVIFTSSTAVYPQDVELATEDMEIQPDNPRAAVLLSIEKELLSQKKFAATVIRFGGLYGPDRPIGKFLAGKKDLSDPDQPVNLIHQDDSVAVIHQIILQGKGGEIFNACTDAHPTRKELYTLAAQKMVLPLPVFGQQTTKFKRIVSNAKLKKVLNYQFHHPDPLRDI